MSNDEPTQDVPNDAATKPMLEAVLDRITTVAEALTARINEVAADLTGEIAQLRKDVDQRFDAVVNDVALLRKDVEQGFRRVERKIELLNNDFLSMRGDQEDLLRRVEDLEKKAS
jgi:hypothetical protein